MKKSFGISSIQKSLQPIPIKRRMILDLNEIQGQDDSNIFVSPVAVKNI